VFVFIVFYYSYSLSISILVWYYPTPFDGGAIIPHTMHNI